MVTSASPRMRLPVLQGTGLPWGSLIVYEIGQRGAMAGPFDLLVGDIAAVEHLPSLGYSHFAYVCVK